MSIRMYSNKTVIFQVIIFAVHLLGNRDIIYIVTNLMIHLAFIIQFGIIVFYHFLMYTHHCNVDNTVRNIKDKLTKFSMKDDHDESIIAMLDVPKHTYNCHEHQDGLVSDDF